jgi:hypothetical protein
MAKTKGPGRPEPLEAVLEELETCLARYRNEYSPKAAKDDFMRGLYSGYIDGLKKAISIVNMEIGLRQDPPNINYPGERPQ